MHVNVNVTSLIAKARDITLCIVCLDVLSKMLYYYEYNILKNINTENIFMDRRAPDGPHDEPNEGAPPPSIPIPLKPVIQACLLSGTIDFLQSQVTGWSFYMYAYRQIFGQNAKMDDQTINGNGDDEVKELQVYLEEIQAYKKVLLHRRKEKPLSSTTPSIDQLHDEASDYNQETTAVVAEHVPWYSPYLLTIVRPQPPG